MAIDTVPSKLLDPLVATALQPADVGTAAAEDVAAGGTGDLLRADGDGSSLTGIIQAGGDLKTASVWSDEFTQSRSAGALSTAGYTLVTPGTSAIAEDGTSLKITTESGVTRNWYSSTRTCANLALPTFRTFGRNVCIYAKVRYPAADDTGVGMVLCWDAADNWYRISHVYASSTSSRDAILGPNTSDYNTADGGAEGWCGFYIVDNYVQPVSLIRAWASGVPEFSDWDFLRPAGRLITTLRNVAFTVRMIGLSEGSNPGCVVEIGGLYIDQLL